jgi:hypothetical protein
MGDATVLGGGPATLTGRRSGGHDLVHCPRSWDRYLPDAADPAPGGGPEDFLLTGELPLDHALLNDGPGRFHDPQAVTEAVREVGAELGYRYFGVPQDRPGLFHRFALELTDLDAWRVDPRGGARIDTDLRAVPVNLVNGVPRGLEFRLDTRIDGRRCATGTAALVFLMPTLYRNFRAHERRTASVGPEQQDRPPGPVLAAAPGQVGRGRPDNVLVGALHRDRPGPLSTWVRSEGPGPLFAPQQEQLSSLHLLEALRQASLLSAGRSGGLDPARSTLASIEVRFRGPAEPGLPLRCTPVPGRPRRDRDGRGSLPVSLTLAQDHRTVVEARTVVVQDLGES